MSRFTIKKATLIATALVTMLGMQQKTLLGDLATDGQSLTTAVTAITNIQLASMLEANGSIDLNTKTASTPGAAWDLIKALPKNQSGMQLQSIAAGLFFAKVKGALIMNYAKDFFADANNFKAGNDADAIKTEIKAAITAGLAKANCTLAITTYTFDTDIKFSTDEADVSSMITTVANAMAQAVAILTKVKDLAESTGNTAFLLCEINNKTVRTHITEMLAKIETDITTELTTLSTNVTNPVAAFTAINAEAKKIAKNIQLKNLGATGLTTITNGKQETIKGIVVAEDL